MTLQSAARLANISPPPPYFSYISDSYLSCFILFLCLLASTATEAQAQSATISSTNPNSLSETNLHGATATVALSGVFIQNRGTGQYELITDIPGLSFRGARGTVSAGNRQITLTLDYNNSDFDTNRTLAIRVLSSAHTGSTNLTTGNVTVTAVVEPAPGQVTGLLVTPGTEQLSLTWTAVSDATGYQVQWKSGSESATDYDNTRQAAGAFEKAPDIWRENSLGSHA